MKKIIPILALILVLSPVLANAQTINATNNVEQQLKLINVLLEKVKLLQSQLDSLLLEQSKKVISVEIVSKDKEYKEEIAPLVDSLEEKNSKKKLLEVKLEESKCTKPYSFISKGVRKFNCKNKDYEFSATSTLYILDNNQTIASLGKIFDLNDIKIKPPIVCRDSDYSCIAVPETAIIPPSKKVISITKEIEVLDKEIDVINDKIKFIKLRYGI